jgi:hypothetical protein
VETLPNPAHPERKIKNMKNHPKNRWQDSVAKTLDPVARLVYRSNLIGEDPTLTNTGGGNTSPDSSGYGGFMGNGVGRRSAYSETRRLFLPLY